MTHKLNDVIKALKTKCGGGELGLAFFDFPVMITSLLFWRIKEISNCVITSVLSVVSKQINLRHTKKGNFMIWHHTEIFFSYFTKSYMKHQSSFPYRGTIFK